MVFYAPLRMRERRGTMQGSTTNITRDDSASHAVAGELAELRGCVHAHGAGARVRSGEI